MKKALKSMAAMLALVFMTFLLSSGCAVPEPGDPYNPINKLPPGTEGDVVQIRIVYDQDLADRVASGEVEPMAIDPSAPITYVAIGGDAVNPGCDDPYNPACRIDISSSCSGGVCNASVVMAIGTKRIIWSYYGDQVHVERLQLMSAQMVPSTTYNLGNFMTVSADTLPVTNPLHKSWPGACVRVDRPTTTTVEVNRDVATWINCQDGLYSYELYGKGDSMDNRLDDDLLPWAGTTTHDGDMKIKSSLLPDTIPPLALFPRILWNIAATPAPAYSHRFTSVTSAMSLWFAFYSHDRGSAALPGDISPIKGGIYVKTYKYDPATRTFAVTASSAGCAGASPLGYGVELVNMQNYNQSTPSADPFYILQIQGTNATTNCPIQGADTRPVIFGLGT